MDSADTILDDTAQIIRGYVHPFVCLQSLLFIQGSWVRDSSIIVRCVQSTGLFIMLPKPRLSQTHTCVFTSVIIIINIIIQNPRYLESYISSVAGEIYTWKDSNWIKRTTKLKFGKEDKVKTINTVFFSSILYKKFTSITHTKNISSIPNNKTNIKIYNVSISSVRTYFRQQSYMNVLFKQKILNM